MSTNTWLEDILFSNPPLKVDSIPFWLRVGLVSRSLVEIFPEGDLHTSAKRTQNDFYSLSTLGLPNAFFPIWGWRRGSSTCRMSWQLSLRGSLDRHSKLGGGLCGGGGVTSPSQAALFFCHFAIFTYFDLTPSRWRIRNSKLAFKKFLSYFVFGWRKAKEFQLKSVSNVNCYCLTVLSFNMSEYLQFHNILNCIEKRSKHNKTVHYNSTFYFVDSN